MSDTNNQPIPKTSDTKLPQDMPDTRDQPPPEMSNTNNQPLHETSDTETSDTSNQPVEDGPGQTISPYNHPCEDLLDEGRRRDYMDICVPLQNAIIIGDWEATKEILDNNSESWDLLGYSILPSKGTPLHWAAKSQSVKIVENLVDRMTEQQLVLQNKFGFTALTIAAIGNVHIVRFMVERCPQLLTIRSNHKTLPIFSAALYGNRNVFAYLYGKYKSMARNDWTYEDIHSVFLNCVEADLFDCALEILDDNDTSFPVYYGEQVLCILARKTHAFKDMKSWKISITWVRLAKRESVATELLRKIWKNILKKSSDEINDILKGPMIIGEDKKEKYPFQVLYTAAETGNTRFLVELLRGYPEISSNVNGDNHTIFHIAVSHRHESIYNLLYEMGSVPDTVSILKDKHKNNMLHLAGMKAKSALEDVAGAAFQMQRELLWFEEVNSIVPPYCREQKNDDGFTPLQLFIENHQDMVSEGEKWMKETANQCMVVAALITTVVFSVAFTFPGGYDQNNGLPIFLKDGPFVGFIIFDAISLILSSTSILMFLSILTSRYTQEDFRISLPRKLMIGLTSLFFSIITMMVVFTISFFVLYRNKLITIPIIIGVVALVPIVLYMKLQFPLLVDVYRSTYGSRYLFRPKKRVLYYRNPSF